MAVAKAPVEILVSQSRAFSDDEFTAHCRQTMTCIASGKRNQDCLVVLRDLYRYLACRKKRRSIADELMKQLKGIVIETGKCPTKMRLLAMLILREVSPTVAYVIKISTISADVNWLPLLFPLIFAQGEELGHIASHVPQFVRWVQSSPVSNSLQRNSLLCLHLIQYYYGAHLVTEEKVNEISSQMVRWLGNVSTYSAPNPHQLKIFSGSKTKSQPVSELDGSASHSFYTLLNLAEYCFPDQFLNIHIFSILRQWLCNTWSMQEGLGDVSFEFTPSKDRENLESPFEPVSFTERPPFEDSMLRTSTLDDDYEHISDKLVSSPVSNSPSLNDIRQAFATGDSGQSTPVLHRDEDSVSVGRESNLSGMRQVFGSESSVFSEGGRNSTQSLARKAISYCYRLLKQSERKPSTSQDTILVKACVVEAVTLLDFFCTQEKALVPKAIQAIRRIYKVVKVWPYPATDALLPMVLFFINHGEVVILDSEPYCKFFFGEVLGNGFSSPEFAFETVTFCLENLEKLCQSTSIFYEFFPNLFKILAWFPRTFLKEFLELLPAMISEKTSIEVFHFLLDLPCLTSALETVKQSGKQGNTSGESHVSTLRKSVAAYQDALYKPIFAFILRQKGGIADTIDKLDVLHSVFQDCVENPRVLVCSQVAWLMLKIYLKSALKNENGDAAGKLLPVLLERVTSIFNIESYKKNIQSLLADEILVIFKHHPSLVVDYSNELIEFVNTRKSLETGFEFFFTNLVWVIGEYVSSKYDERCGNQLIIQYHEAIECVTYELAMEMNVKNSQDICSSRLVSVLMSALAKLASRCQDLIPKVILCISKVSKIRYELCLDLAEKEALFIRATELISLLKLPNIAPSILSPDPSLETGRLHLDRHTSLPFFLETAKDMMLSN